VVADQDGLPVTSLTTSSARFILTKLVPESGTVPAHWQSYINRKDGSFMQATTENNGTLVYNGNGAYTYTFATDPATATYPTGLNASDPNFLNSGLPVGYDASLVHRVAIQISGQGLPSTNASYDFIPAGGTVTNAMKRDIVMTASCNECHNKLALHGGGRVETKFCVTCHNPGSTDGQAPNNTVDFKVMIHKIHRGKDLPSVADGGGSYIITGYANSVHDYSPIGFPMDIRNCTKCHDGADAGTPNGDNWKTKPSQQACGSCHDHVTFNDGVSPQDTIINDPDGAGYLRGHGSSANNVNDGFMVYNGTCAGCHPATGGLAPIVTRHLIPETEAAKLFEFHIDAVNTSYTAPNLTVQFYVKNPVSGTNYDLDTSTEFNSGGNSSLSLLVGWDTSDYSNDLSGSNPGQPVSINALTDLTVTEVGGGTFVYEVTKDLTGMGAETSGTLVVALQGHPSDSTGTLRVPVKSAVLYVSTSGGTPDERREVVNITAKCDQCHGTLSMHGANRVDEGQVCVICHNPFATDITKRVGGPFLDGKPEESIDFKRMVHAIHSQGATKRIQPLVVYGYGNNAHEFSTSSSTGDDVHFPGRVSDCRTCHIGDTFMLPLGQNVFGSTVLTGVLADQSDDKKFSRTASVCSACHDSFAATSHMSQNGGAVEIRNDSDGSLAVDLTKTLAELNSGAGESCPLCHGPGRFADISVWHVVSP
jgi:OmcA/MtrC family decaheme c-type cytochrome